MKPRRMVTFRRRFALAFLVTATIGASALGQWHEEATIFEGVGEETRLGYAGATVGDLALLLLRQDRLAEAEPYLRESLEGKRRGLGDEHPGTMNAIGQMADLLARQGKLAEAEGYHRELRALHRRVLGAAHPRTLASAASLAELLSAQERYEEAETLLLAAHADLDETLPARNRAEGLSASIERLARLYEAWGKPDEAAAWRERLEALQESGGSTPAGR